MDLEKQKSALDKLWYELWVFNGAGERLVFLETNKTRGLEMSVYLESFLVHTRNIVDFLENKDNRDIRCSDFGANKISVNLPPDNTKIKINRWLSHIAKERIEELNPKWKYPIIRKEINRCFGIFLNQLDHDCFPSEKGRQKLDFESLLI